jgi:hypothetical protein
MQNIYNILNAAQSNGSGVGGTWKEKGPDSYIFTVDNDATEDLAVMLGFVDDYVVMTFIDDNRLSMVHKSKVRIVFARA